MGWGHQDLATVASKIVTLGQPAQSTTIGQLQALLDAFTAVTTTGGCTCRCRTRATPATVYAARPKAAPGDWAAGTHDRVRTDRVDTDGKLTLRVNGRLRHIGIGRTVAPMLIHDLHIRVINAATGELLRELKLGPGLQPTGEPPGPEPKRPRP